MGKTRPLGLLMGLAGCAAFGWGIYNLMGIGSCGGEYPPCPAEATPWFIAVAVGIVVAILSIFAGGGGIAFMGIFATVGIASLLRAANGGTDGDTTFPLVFGLGFLLVPVLPLFLGAAAVRRARRAARLVAEGRTGIAEVLSVADTGVTINNNPRVRVRVRIDPEDGSPSFEGEKAMTVPRVAIPRAGDRYPAWYDPGDRAAFGLGTDVEAHAPAAVRALFEKARRPVAPMPAPVEAAPPPADWVAELGRLNELRMKGALSDAEFAQAKEKLLAAAS